eukprot:scaffold28447_cov99-Amphora_coffeaeformis.AAC.1
MGWTCCGVEVLQIPLTRKRCTMISRLSAMAWTENVSSFQDFAIPTATPLRILTASAATSTGWSFAKASISYTKAMALT